MGSKASMIIVWDTIPHKYNVYLNPCWVKIQRLKL